MNWNILSGDTRMNGRSAISLFGGKNIAIKVPEHFYEKMVQFYKDVLKLKLRPRQDGQISFEFGRDGSPSTLWLDRVPSASQSDVWLELETADLESAKRYFIAQGVTLPEHIEKLPEGFPGFWIADPMGRIFLVTVPD